jgi:hypothetical protein
VRDRYSGSKAELKKVIRVLIDTPYEELDRWDDRNLIAGLPLEGRQPQRGRAAGGQEGQHDVIPAFR